ncbi:MAG TPA: hypothetical protein VG605_19770 [Puia sp.]|nr:hypothetical protein [Puia sp.]
MRGLLVVLLVFLIGYEEVQGQDLTGQWTGTAMAEGQNHKLVLSITEGDSSFAGVLHWYTPRTRTIRHIIVSGRFYGRDSTLSIREDSGAASNGVAVEGPPGGFYILFYRRTAGRRDVLEGQWHAGDEFTGRYDLTIRLEKKAPPFIPLPIVKPVHKNDSADTKRYPILRGRESVVAARIPVTGFDTAKIELYDNGEIDGDSVSLFLNNNLVVQHVRLAAEPKVLLVPIDKSLSVNRLLLVAENLGRLPPNTALMVVTVHGKTYNLFLSTDYKKNASIEFNLQE